MAKIQYKFVMLKSRAKQPYHWVCYAPNGRIKFHSENYVRKESGEEVIEKHISDLRPGIGKYEDKTGERGVS